MPDDSQWTNAIMPGQETSYNGETMDAGFNPFSSSGLASMFNMGTGNIGGGGDSNYGGYNAPAPPPAPVSVSAAKAQLPTDYMDVASMGLPWDTPNKPDVSNWYTDPNVNWDYNSETMAGPPEAMSLNNFASIIAPKAAELGWTGGPPVSEDPNSGGKSLNRAFAQWVLDSGYHLSGEPTGKNGMAGVTSFLTDNTGKRVAEESYYDTPDPFFDLMLNLGVGGVLGGAPFLGGGGGLAGNLGFGGGIGGAINGAATGGLIAAGNDQNVLKGAISGGLGGFAAGSNFAKDLGVTNPIASKAINSGLGTTAGSFANGRSLGDSLKSGLTSAGMSGTTQALNQIGGSLFGGYGQQGNTNMSGGFGDLWNSWTGGGQQALPDSLEGSMGPVEGQTDITESSYDPGASNYRYAGDQVPNLFGSQLPQQQQEVGQKQAMGFSMPSMGNLGNFLSNNAGNLASLLYGVYNNRKQQNAINGQMNNLQGMFGQNSPYAAQLRNKLMAQAAAKGTRSNVAGREVQLQAALAQNAAGLAPSLYNMQNAKNGLQNNQMNMLLQGGRLLGPGLAQLFGQQQQPPAFQADANTMGGLW